MAEETKQWPVMSADPVIQWCVVEALAARLRKERSDNLERHQATSHALARARAEVSRAVS